MSACTRALDRPNVPLLISTTKFAINIILDLLFVSKFHVLADRPTTITQALIRFVCDLTAAIAGLGEMNSSRPCKIKSSVYFAVLARRTLREHDAKAFMNNSTPLITKTSIWPSWCRLKTMAPSAGYTLGESMLRNVIYLWLISGIVAMGDDYATGEN